LVNGIVISVIIIIVSYYALLQFLYTVERKLQREAPKQPSHEEMVAVALKKQDEQMTDEEFNLKYSALRHETYRVSAFPRKYYHKVGMFFHYDELYLIHHGYQNLEKNVPIIKPIIILGDFRSGTSNLERLIVHHKDVAAFTYTHAFIWQAPKLFDMLIDWFGTIRISQGATDWNEPFGPGLYYPHSSNVLINRGKPMEVEIAWKSCKRNLYTNRNNNWNEFDTDKNEDNNSNIDLLTDELEDPEFEKLLKTCIRMLLYHYKAKRFIWKNPLNGFRVGYLKKIFPDAKFIHIARNPIKTCKSQRILQEGNLRGYYMNEENFRKNNMYPPIPKSHYDAPRESWIYLFHGQYPNDLYFQLWFPRVFVRTIPEYKRITRYVKQGKKNCATAQAVAQHERVVLESIQNSKLEEGKNLFTLFHEDLLDNATLVSTKLFEFLELPLTKPQLIEILEKEDFPNGQARIKRVESMSNIESETAFGEETVAVREILEPAMQRFYQRRKNPNFYSVNSNKNA